MGQFTLWLVESKKLDSQFLLVCVCKLFVVWCLAFGLLEIWMNGELTKRNDLLLCQPADRPAG